MRNISKLNSHLGYQIRQISNAVSHAFASKLLDSRVTVAEWVILREMYDDSNSTQPNMIATKTRLTRGAISKLIDRLFNKGLVTRVEASQDRRYQEIELTTDAKNLVPHLSKIADENDRHFFSVLTSEEEDSLKLILIKLSKAHKLTITPIK